MEIPACELTGERAREKGSEGRGTGRGGGSVRMRSPQLDRSLSLVPRGALVRKWYNGVHPTLKQGGQPFVPLSQQGLGPVGGGDEQLPG